jgi:uncharacterized membrane protein YjgN (DUF898 family)
MRQWHTANRAADAPTPDAAWEPPAAEITAGAPAEPIPAPSIQAFSFTGRASEYFGIWIVNVLLSILTLGIYSAWAKVRNKRYFYGNTLLAGYAFDYLAPPTQILKGRLIVVALFFLWTIAVDFFWWVDEMMLLVVLPLVTPWAVVRALTFAARYSSHRNIRFDFRGTVREAFWVYLVLPLGALLTLGLLLPYAAWREKRFRLGYSAFGRTPFVFSGSLGEFYRTHGRGVLVALPFLLAGCGLAYASGAVDLLMLLAMIATASPDDASPRFDILPIANDGLLALAIACLVLSILVPALYVGTRLTNYSWSATQVGPHRFALDLGFGRILWLWLSNFLGIVLSLGLLIPWARIRMARYRIERLRLAVAGSLDGMIAGDRQRLAATGDQLGEALDLDLGF